LESPDSPSVRPDITSIIEQLQDEARDWSPTSRLQSPTIPMERKAISESTTESSGFPDGLVGNTGDDFENIGRGGGTLDSDLNDILKGIDNIIGPEQPDDYPDGRDTPVRGELSSPTMSPNVIPREGARSTPSPSRNSLLSLHQILPSHQNTSTHQRPKKQKSGLGKMWSGLKKFMRKFGGDGNQSPPKLSDKLVPERDDEVKWKDSPFSEPRKPAKTRK